MGGVVDDGPSPERDWNGFLAANIHSFKDDIEVRGTYTNKPANKGNGTIVIDNGTYECKAGWGGSARPSMIFPNLFGKTKTPLKEGEVSFYVGNDTNLIEGASRLNYKTPFDGACMTSCDIEEIILDYTFCNLNVHSQGAVQHPIVLTEPVCNPNYCRQIMSELLFECYDIPSVCYGVDSLFSFYQNCKGDVYSGCVVSCGNMATHILPIWNGRFNPRSCKRLNVGGSDLVDCLHTLVDLKYPDHRSGMDLARARELLHDYCMVAPNYQDSLRQWESEQYFLDETVVMQLEFDKPDEKDEKQLQEREEKKKENIARLKEMAALKRQNQLKEKEKQLAEMEAIKMLFKEDKGEFMDALEDFGLSSKKQLEQAIEESVKAIRKIRNRIQGVIDEPEEKEREPPVCDLLDKPDSELTEDQIKEKKKQRFLKNAHEGRLKAKRIRDELRAEEERLEKLEDEKREADLQGWLKNIHIQRDAVLKRRKDRHRLKQELQNRRSHASKQRMRLIAQQAQDMNENRSRRKQKDDTFGMNDSDWSVYRTINKDDDDSESERDESEITKLEAQLIKYDPQFREEQSKEEEEAPLETMYQVRLSVDRIRVPEVLFQPSIVGNDQTGIVEMMQYVLRNFSAEQQIAISKNVFLTGGNSSYQGMLTRLEREVRSIRPFGTPINVFGAADPIVDAWKGASLFSKSGRFKESSISRAEYLEMGGEYLKEHECSNIYFATPE
eukprot:Nk52_evm5s745 gene=Nk52_evmTU5s745